MRSRVLGVAISLGATFLAVPAVWVQAPASYPDREAYFGETHVHTSWSLDAFALGNMLTTPADAYKYFQGSRTYNIANGKIVTELVGTPIEIKVYKVGDKYVAARSNEFGYANYEIVPVVQQVNPLR